MEGLNIPTSVTVSCPKIGFNQNIIYKSCLKCDFFKGFSLMTNAAYKEIKDEKTGLVAGKRPIMWHEKYMVNCAHTITRRCFDESITEK